MPLLESLPPHPGFIFSLSVQALLFCFTNLPHLCSMANLQSSYCNCFFEWERCSAHFVPALLLCCIFQLFALIIIQLVFRGEREAGRSCTVCKYKKFFCKWGTGRWGMCFKRVLLITDCIKNHSEKV